MKAAANQNSKTNSAKVFEAVANIYNISPKQAESVVAYHGSLRLCLGSLLSASQGVGYFETRESNASKGVGLLAKIASFFSLGVSEVVSEGFKEFEQFLNEGELKQVAFVATAVSELGIHKFSKQLATQIVKDSAQDLAKLTPKQARERAKEDALTLKKEMGQGAFEDLVNLSEAENLLSEGLGKSTSELQDKMCSKIAKRRNSSHANNGHSNHEDLGPFTHSVLTGESPSPQKDVVGKFTSQINHEHGNAIDPNNHH